MAGIRAFRKRLRKKAKRQASSRKEIALQQIVPLLPLIDRVIYTYFRWAVPRIKTEIYDIYDLRQEGILGIIRAIELYNPRKGKLANYARWHIRGRIGRFLWQNSFPNITISSRPKTGLSFLPIDVPINGHDPFTPADLVSFQADHLRISENEHQGSVRKLALLVLKRVPRRDRQLILEYFGICGCKKGGPVHGHAPMTLKEIGTELGVSRERVRQRIQETFSRLRRGGDTAIQVLRRDWENL